MHVVLFPSMQLDDLSDPQVMVEDFRSWVL